MFKVIEVAEKLKVSKVSIYNKVNQNKDILKQHVKKVKSVTYITDEGLEIIEKLFCKDNEFKTLNNDDNSLNNDTVKQDNSMVEEFKTLYDERINDLKVQIDGLNKDKENLHQQIDKLTELNKNAQILIKQEQDKVLLLESKKEPLLKRLFGKKEQVS